MVDGDAGHAAFRTASLRIESGISAARSSLVAKLVFCGVYFSRESFNGMGSGAGHEKGAAETLVFSVDQPVRDSAGGGVLRVVRLLHAVLRMERIIKPAGTACLSRAC